MQTTDVSCAVIVHGGMVLAANRGQNVSNSGQWEFPGGKPKDDEQPKDCVVRRVQEELNLNIQVVDELKPYKVSVSESKQFNIHPFVAEIVNGTVELTNHSRAAWFMPIQLMSLAWPQSDLPIVEEIVGRVFRTGKVV